jgi:AcrR family transcriptional regulator
MDEVAQEDGISACGQQRKSKGRPVVMEPQVRRKRILSALDDLFTEVGIEGMTMAAIARRAGMSKQTVYHLFENRDALFDAYLEQRFAHQDDGPGPGDTSGGLEERLRRLFRLGEPAEAWDLPIAMLRLAIAEAEHHPKLARRCLSEGTHSKQAMVKRELDLAVARGEITVTDTTAAAALLLDMLHLPVLEALVTPNYKPSVEAWEKRFTLGLEVFRNGIS